MVKHCVPAGCSNTYSDNVSLYKFTRDLVLRNKHRRRELEEPDGRLEWFCEHSVLSLIVAERGAQVPRLLPIRMPQARQTRGGELMRSERDQE